MSATEFSPTAVSRVHPARAIEGARLSIEGSDLLVDGQVPELTIGGVPATVLRASPRSMAAFVPTGADAGRVPVVVGRVTSETASVELGSLVVSGVHLVDSPAYDRQGNLYVTDSGRRGEATPVAVYRVTPDGAQDVFVRGITNATSLAFDPEDRLHVSSRFDGVVYRVNGDGSYAPLHKDLGVACGMVFDEDGTLFVGDRSGTVFRCPPGREPIMFATLPPSVAAYHLAMGPDRAVYITGPTLGSRDSVYRLGRDGRLDVVSRAFGRPQGLAFDAAGRLHVAEALAGAAGLYRLDGDRPELVVACPELVGAAFGPSGEVALGLSERVYRFANLN